MKKILVAFLALFLFIPYAGANSIDKLIKDSNIGLFSTVSIDVFNLDKNKSIYKRNEKKLLNPASVLKTLTFASSYNALSKDYKFNTELYKYNNDIYLKLSGDTLLTTNDVKKLFSQAKKKYNFEKINNLYVDNSIIDSKSYPDGWMVDDMWPNQRILSPYIIDDNYISIYLRRSSLNTKINIIQNDSYKLPIINNLILSSACDVNDIKIEKIENSDSILSLSGCVDKDINLNVPVLNSEIYFKVKLFDILKKSDIVYDKKIITKKTPTNALKIASVNHSIQDISKKILKNSDNFASEIVFKTAAAKYINYSHPATLDDAIKMFYETFDFIDKDEVKIKDGSGVSRYNLINTSSIVAMMNKIVKMDGFLDLMATADEGTLSNRLLFLKGNLRAKTGTLADMSSIVAVFKTKNNNNIVVSSIIQNSPRRKALLKSFENSLIALIYRKY